MSISLGCHIWTFPECTVAEAAGIVRALGLAHMDLGNARDFDPVDIAAHVADEAGRLNQIRAETGVTFVDVFPHLPPSFSTNHPDPDVRARHRTQWAALMDFAAAIGVAGVTFSPGRYWPGESPADDFDRAAEERRHLVAAGSRRGLVVRMEPHLDSVAWTPELAQQMLAAVPGLSLTLD
jgi:sugar phosphate isomerase/epimerase